MSKKRVAIPEPCPANVWAMPKCEKGLYCAACDKHVLDLRNKKLEEVNRALETYTTACIVIDERNAVRKAWPITEKTADFLRRYRFVRLATVLVTASLFFSSCYKRSRTVCGGWGKKSADNSEVISEK